MDKKDITVDINEAEFCKSPKRPIRSIHLERHPSANSPTEKDRLEHWDTCCSRSSSRFVKYLVQVVVSIIILIFAIVNISLGHNDPVYYSLLTLIVGVFIPSPTLKKDL